MSPKFGQPVKESPRVERITVSFTIDEKTQLEEYCKKNHIRLSELCRKEVLKLVETTKTHADNDLRRLRKEAQKKGWKISKGYRKTRIDNKFVLDHTGNKIIGYTLTDSSNVYIAGLESEEIFTMDFDELQAHFN